MKRLFIVLMAFTTFYLTSCQKDEDTTPNADIYGTWTCSETCVTFGTQNYHVDISADNNSSDVVVIDNFFNLGLGKSIRVNISGQSLTINNANLDGNTFNGSGTVSSNNNTINWNYTFDDGNGPENVTATYTRL